MYSLRFPNSSPSLLEINSDLMCHFGNYLSDRCLYPGAAYLIEASDAYEYSDWINNRKLGCFRRPLSLDLYAPNSSSSCFYCHLNQLIPANHSTETYSNYLLREIRLQGQLFKGDSKVDQIYFGGGSPAFLNDSQLNTLTQEIKRYFTLVEGGDFCVEIDTRQLINCSMRALNEMGFNCAIVGVQDFDQQAQHSEQCIQSEEAAVHTVRNIRRAGFKSVRVELSYGLTGQDLDKFASRLDKIIETDPDQVKLLNYQHLIEEFKPQSNNILTGLPATVTKFEMTLLAISRLAEAGYSHIGMNLFARYDDPLAVAQRQGRLHYGLRGFSIHPDCDHVALGVSGIGRIGPILHQNHCDLLQYYDKLEQNILPILRGIELNADDLLRRSIMYALICHLVISYDSVEAFFPIDFKQYFVTELTDLQAYAEAGLVTLDNEEIAVTTKGQLFIGGICRIFDKYLRKYH